MQIVFNIVDFLESIIASKAKEIDEFDSSFSPDVRTADPRFGDFQANGILPFAKQSKANPRQLAQKLVDALNSSDLIDPDYVEMSIAGPGFINFKFKSNFYVQWLKKYKDEDTFRNAAGNVYNGKRISIDYSSPNTAKQMHVGHIRSMIIGEAIQRMLSFCGAKVIRDNHIGDWGTQFGIIIMAVKHFKFDLDAPHLDPLEDLENIYKQGYQLFESSEEWKDRARQELVKLQQGDPENVALWEKVNKVSYAAFQEIYDIMNIQFDVVQGESFYRNKVDRIYKELEETGVAKESQGALVVFHKSPGKDQKDYPLIIRKKDGASNYATTDLATVLHHVEENKVQEMVYVTDGRQQDHFKYLFKTVDQWFDAKHYQKPEFRHVWFGTILGEDGKAIKTRSGNPIKLKDLINEGIERDYKIVSDKNPDLDEQSRQHIAKVVGIAAIRYADLVQNRTTDYIFSWDKIISFDGNTAPYLLYAVARIYSIFRKADIDINNHTWEDDAINFETDEELTLARKIVEFPIVLRQAIADLRPHVLCGYLFELAGSFSSFYNANKVIVDDKDTKARRLLLCSRTLKTLETGLHLLGLETLEKM